MKTPDQNSENQPFVVFSACDGISAAQVAMDRLGIRKIIYYASEIDKKAIMITQRHYPNTIQVGDIRYVIASDYPQITLLCGGTPCTDFSFAGKKKGMSTKCKITIVTLKQYLKLKAKGFEFEGQSYLFWEFVRLLKEFKPKYFFLENVNMLQIWQDVISEALGVKPIRINSNRFSCQNRDRLYWTNMPIDPLPEDKGLKIKDVLYKAKHDSFTLSPKVAASIIRRENCVQWDKTGGGHGSQMDRGYFKNGKFGCIPNMGAPYSMNICLNYKKNIYRRGHPVEAERAQTFPDFYTEVEGVTNNQRMSALGNSWTIDVICHLFKHLQKQQKNVNFIRKVA
jgi:DNA (cytosine-5)-methyltransferase 3A